MLRKAEFLRSPSGISLSSTSAAFFSTGTDSPVSEASSTLRLTRRDQAQVGRHVVAGFQQDDVARHQLAGRHRDLWPSRMTWAFGAAIFFSAASACSAFDSWITPTTAFRTTMHMMAMESTYSPSASAISAATIRMITR